MESPLQKLMLYPVDIATSNLELQIFFHEPLIQLNQDEAQSIVTLMKNPIDNVAEHLAKVLSSSISFKDLHMDAQKAFNYFFDKSVEIVYNIRANISNQVEFIVEDLLNGWGGDAIPEYVQLKVTPNIPKVVGISNKTFKHILQDEEFLNLNPADVLKSLFYGAMYLGVGYCLRLDLDDMSEMEKYLNEDD